MAKDRNGYAGGGEARGEDDEERVEEPSRRERHQKTKSRKGESSGAGSEDSGGDSDRGKKRKRRERRSGRSRRRRSDSESKDGSSSTFSESETDFSGDSESGSESETESEEEMRRRKKKERRRKARVHEKERRRRKEKERERKKREERRKKKDKIKEKKKRKKENDRGSKGAVTNSWGKYGVIKETDMWNKRPEFTAWLAEVKQVNLEALSNWEEKQMFKEFMEDHNTATFPSKKYFDLDAYHHRKMDKEMKKGIKKVIVTERTNFNDEEQRRQELLMERERQKEEKVDALKRSMQSGMAQAMKDQARLREEMAYQYKLGNFEAAAAIQRRLDPDVSM